MPNTAEILCRYLGRTESGKTYPEQLFYSKKLGGRKAGTVRKATEGGFSQIAPDSPIFQPDLHKVKQNF